MREMRSDRRPEPGLRSLVPDLVAELATPTGPTRTVLDGSLLCADISGFTALSERLASTGRAGAEEITARINACFAALIDEVRCVGGDVLKFGGDSMTVIVRGDGHQWRAAAAGLAMQRAIRASAPTRRADLKLTVVVTSGPFDVYVVGDDARDLLIAGENVDALIQLEQATAPGDVIVDARVAAHLPAGIRRHPRADGFVVTGQPTDAMTTHGEARTAAEAEVARLRPFVATTILDQLDAFARLGGEHRLATIGFVRIGGLAAEIRRSGGDAVAHALHQLYVGVVDTCGRFGVTVLHSDVSADGCKVVLCSGAPVSRGDTHDAVLHAALRIATLDSPFSIRQGVQSGRVFAGFLGSPERCAYTVMGDAVNTAARVLDRAGDRDVVAVEAVLEQSRTIFQDEPLEPFTVKGKAAPIAARLVRGTTSTSRRHADSRLLVGRTDELALLQRAVERGSVAVEIVGAPGTGKSRLLDTLRHAVESALVLTADCTSFGAAAPYGVAQTMLRPLLGASSASTPTLAGNALTELTRRVAPRLLPMLPLLAVAFGVEVPSTPQARSVDPAFRTARTHEGVVELLDAVVEDTSFGRLVLLVEDAHWIDASSGHLLDHLIDAAATRRWTVISSRRPTTTWSMPALPHVSTLQLEPLSAASTRRLAIEVSTTPLRDTDIDLVLHRSQGNPLFAIELVRMVSDRAGDGDDLPDTVEQIIADRLDRLDPTALRVVRLASVLGNSFEEVTVAAIADAEGDRADVGAALHEAHLAGALARTGPSRWSFDHALYRDAAYSALPFRRRQHLHRLAAEILERDQQDPASIASILCLHYSRAGDHERTWTYGRMAGDAAERQHATNEAVVSYERARVACRFSRSIGPDQRALLDEKLADQYFVAARFDDAERSIRRSRRLSTDPVARARLERKLAAVFERQGFNDRTLRAYERAVRRAPPGTRSRAWLAERTHALLGHASTIALRGDYLACIELAERALQDATRIADDALAALALERIHLGESGLAQPDAESIGLRAVALYEQVDEPNGLSRMLNNLGVEAYFDSRWKDASGYYLTAGEAARRSGNVVLTANATLNNAVILADQGHWEESLTQFDDAARNFTAVGNKGGQSAHRLFSSIPLMWLGDLDAATERLADARERLTELRFVDLMPQLVSRELQLAVLLGQATDELFESTAAQLGSQPSFVSQMVRCRAAVSSDAGDVAAARAVLIEDTANPSTVGYERALTLHALASLFPDDPAAAGWRTEAGALLAGLGVVRVPPWRRADLGGS